MNDISNIIEKLCCYCENAIQLRYMETYMCKKHGAVEFNATCNKFLFDPLKLIPVRHGKKSTGGLLSEEDFDLGD